MSTQAIIEADRVIQVSDIHLGWVKSNEEEFLDFLNNEVEDISADLLIVAGDMLEMWKRGIEDVMTTFSEHISALKEAPIDTIVLPGNHDRRIIDSEFDALDIRDEIIVQSGDLKFTATHGNEFDPPNASQRSNKSLCLTSTQEGQKLAKRHKEIIETSVLSSLTRTPQLLNRRSLKTISHLADPGILAKPSSRSRLKRIKDRAEQFSDNFITFGHTHVPGVWDDSANSGSWAGPRNTYLIIDNGDVEMKVY